MQWYKFYGVFEIDKDATRAATDVGKSVCIYRRKSEEGSCPKCDVQVKAIAAEEMAGFVGKILEADLLDMVPCETKSGEKKTGDVKVFPGQRFWVEEAAVTSPSLTCKTSDRSVLSNSSAEGETVFYIPKRDLELGYFKVVRSLILRGAGLEFPGAED